MYQRLAPSSWLVLILILSPLVLGWKSVLYKPTRNGTPNSLRITAIEGSGYCHNELQIALAATFKLMESSTIEIIWKKPQYESPNMVQRILNTTSQVADWSFKMNSDFETIDHLIVLSTCQADFALLERRTKSPFKAFIQAYIESGNRTNLHVVCLIHGISDRSEMNSLRAALGNPNSVMNSLIKQNRFSFATVSAHVRDSFFVSKLFRKRNLTRVPTLILPLVFRPLHAVLEPDWTLPKIVVQGTLEHSRRNYSGLLTDFQDYLVNKKPGWIDFGIELIGNNKRGFVVPDLVDRAVQVLPRLNYDEYYERIGQGVLLLPCFSKSNQSEYMRLRASSSIAASIIAGVPVLATAPMLKLYTFLDPEAVWHRQDNETEMEAVIRIMNDPNSPELMKEKARLTRELRHKLILENANILSSLLRNKRI